jgi:hypothetical protein
VVVLPELLLPLPVLPVLSGLPVLRRGDSAAEVPARFRVRLVEFVVAVRLVTAVVIVVAPQVIIGRASLQPAVADTDYSEVLPR